MAPVKSPGSPARSESPLDLDAELARPVSPSAVWRYSDDPDYEPWVERAYSVASDYQGGPVQEPFSEPEAMANNTAVARPNESLSSLSGAAVPFQPMSDLPFRNGVYTLSQRVWHGRKNNLLDRRITTKRNKRHTIGRSTLAVTPELSPIMDLSPRDGDPVELYDASPLGHESDFTDVSSGDKSGHVLIDKKNSAAVGGQFDERCGVQHRESAGGLGHRRNKSVRLPAANYITSFKHTGEALPTQAPQPRANLAALFDINQPSKIIQKSYLSGPPTTNTLRRSVSGIRFDDLPQHCYSPAPTEQMERKEGADHAQRDDNVGMQLSQLQIGSARQDPAVVDGHRPVQQSTPTMQQQQPQYGLYQVTHCTCSQGDTKGKGRACPKHGGAPYSRFLHGDYAPSPVTASNGNNMAPFAPQLPAPMVGLENQDNQYGNSWNNSMYQNNGYNQAAIWSNAQANTQNTGCEVQLGMHSQSQMLQPTAAEIATMVPPVTPTKRWTWSGPNAPQHGYPGALPSQSPLAGPDPYVDNSMQGVQSTQMQNSLGGYHFTNSKIEAGAFKYPANPEDAIQAQANSQQLQLAGPVNHNMATSIGPISYQTQAMTLHQAPAHQNQQSMALVQAPGHSALALVEPPLIPPAAALWYTPSNEPCNWLKGFTCNFNRIPTYEEAMSNLPFSELAKTVGPSEKGVMYISNIPWELGRAEVLAHIGKFAEVVEAEEPIHITMDRTNGKTQGIYVEFGTPQDVLNTMRHIQTKGGRLGNRHPKYEVSSQEALMKATFPKAKNVIWAGSYPIIHPKEEGNMYASEFKGFVTKDELVMIHRFAECPHRAAYGAKAPQRPYEAMISIMRKYPIYLTEHVTLGERDDLYKYAFKMLEILLRSVKKDPKAIELTPRLLRRFISTMLWFPFNVVQKDDVVFICDLNPLREGLPRHAARWFGVRTIGPTPFVSPDIVEYYQFLVRLATEDPMRAHPDKLRRWEERKQSGQMMSQWGLLDIEYPSNLESLTLAQVCVIEWAAIERALRSGLYA